MKNNTTLNYEDDDVTTLSLPAAHEVEELPKALPHRSRVIHYDADGLPSMDFDASSSRSSISRSLGVDSGAARHQGSYGFSPLPAFESVFGGIGQSGDRRPFRKESREESGKVLLSPGIVRKIDELVETRVNDTLTLMLH